MPSHEKSYRIYGLTQDELPPRTAAELVLPIKHYAQHKVGVEYMKARLGLKRHLIRVFSSLLRYVVVSQSAHHYVDRRGWCAVMMQGFKMLKGRPTRVKVG